MLLALCLLQITAFAIANPFHKYPYVFLLDVGNEELEKVNTEQIRISKQGGSLALRYPAIGNGEDIAHVRVSGIDFGTDLKANIVDGGPGYQYVVLVLMGNPGVNFEAVITVQTVPRDSEETSLQNVDDSSNTNSQISGEDDANDSAEDLSDGAESEVASQVSIKQNAELTQESSNVYNYAVNEALSGYGNSVHLNENEYEAGSDINEREYDDNNDQKDIHIPSIENRIQIEEPSNLDEYTNEEVSSSLTENESKEYQNIEDYASAVDDQNYAYDDGVKPDLYKQYELRGNYEEREAYAQNPQRFIPDDSGTVYIEEPGDNDTLDLEEIFGDDYDDTDNRQYSDTNNNFIDRNDRSAVAY